MNRISLIQEIINYKKAKNYLEIGVERGTTFLRIKAKKKIAIDPNFKISRIKKILFLIKNFSNIYNKYYEITSDNFFESKSDLFAKSGLDVVFIDGLHTFEQSLKDVENCLKFLKDDGIIIMHDCNPTFEASAYPGKSLEHVASLQLDGWFEEWCGDVWKTIAYLRSTRKDLNILVFDIDHGLGIITKGIPKKLLEYTIKEIDKLTYNDLNKNRDKILNLKSNAYFNEFIRCL